LQQGTRRLGSTGSNPVLTTEGGNPETLKEKVADSTERRQHSQVAELVDAMGATKKQNVQVQ
jgi:hypothetical protein